ncbi:sarcolemmal membrane-associated protein [Brassica napus]|uniref:sarcolemmal membrane-associated protein n=1 Tax=Brassica napus TaxID=3708 RepID=UPI0004EEE7EA|nr:sarcolemmal membrane-associated protein [Brassica napus]XP_048623141.1 sarcolemmal membrane-associated protein [Brassica napus]
MSSSSGSFSGRSSSACSSTSDCQNNSFDAEELLQIGSRRMELRKEKDLLKDSQPHSIELVRSLELHTKSLSESRLEDRARIQTMEKELLSCYKEIDYLRDQLIFRSKEVSYLNEHVRNLECKLAESRNVEEEVNCLREELCLSKSENLLLLQELESKETELQCSSLSVEKLEETISSLTLESLCEVESMKLDITALEQALGDAMKIQEESIEEKEYLKRIIKEIQFQSQKAEANAKSFEKQNQELRERIAASKKSIKEFFQSAKARFESENGQQPLNAECFFAELSHVSPVSTEVRECLDAIIKKLELSRNITLIDKMEGMGQQIEIQLHEDTVKRLKEELKQEKLKAKEEAEELTQEMAELRYKMTCLLEEERKRRVCIEQASLQRIAELEAQIKREMNKRSSTDILPLSGL